MIDDAHLSIHDPSASHVVFHIRSVGDAALSTSKREGAPNLTRATYTAVKMSLWSVQKTALDFAPRAEGPRYTLEFLFQSKNRGEG